MNILKKLRKKKIDKVLDNLDKKDLSKRYLYLALGCLIVALAFNIFFKRYGIVCFGVSGLSIVLSHFGVPNTLFIFVCNIILLIISYFALGRKKLEML